MSDEDKRPEKKQKIGDYFKAKEPSKKVEEKEEEDGNGGNGEAAKKMGNILDHLKDPGWRSALKEEINSANFKKILAALEKEKKEHSEIFPPEEDIFSALNLTPLDKVKVVILGQDPYHDNNQAHGLCFSVRPGIKTPPSLKNIYKELESDIPGFKAPTHGFLEKWAKQGVLLLNATLTVQAHKANSHANIGWQPFTDSIIKVINAHKKNVVFILWGGFAQKKGKIIDTKKHHVLAAAHPSPLSVAKFLGCKVFSKTNTYLKEKGIEPVDWTLPMDPNGE